MCSLLYCLLNIPTFHAFFTSLGTGIWFQLSTLLETKFPLTSLWTGPLVLCINSPSSRFQRGFVFSEACLCRSNYGSGTPGGLFVEQISDAELRNPSNFYHSALPSVATVPRYGHNTKNQCCGSGSGTRCFFDPWIQIRNPGWGKNPDPESGMNITDHLSESLETFLFNT
jgi:hypothetical protein